MSDPATDLSQYDKLLELTRRAAALNLRELARYLWDEDPGPSMVRRRVAIQAEDAADAIDYPAITAAAGAPHLRDAERQAILHWAPWRSETMRVYFTTCAEDRSRAEPFQMQDLECERCAVGFYVAGLMYALLQLVADWRRSVEQEQQAHDEWTAARGG